MAPVRNALPGDPEFLTGVPGIRGSPLTLMLSPSSSRTPWKKTVELGTHSRTPPQQPHFQVTGETGRRGQGGPASLCRGENRLGWAPVARGWRPPGVRGDLVRGGRIRVGLNSPEEAQQRAPRGPRAKPAQAHHEKDLMWSSELPIPGSIQATAPGAGKGVGTLHRHRFAPLKGLPSALKI